MKGVGTLLISILLVLATSSSNVHAGYSRYWAKFYETIPANDVVAFEPKPVANKGTGYVKHNVVVSPEGRRLGTVGGMYFYNSVNIIEDIVTIYFYPELQFPFGGSSLNLRGRWVMSRDGSEDADQQELSIVGGQGNMRYALGSVYYQRVRTNPTVFFVTCDIYIRDLWSSIPKIHFDFDSDLKSPDDAAKVQPESESFPGEAPALDILPQVVDFD